MNQELNFSPIKVSGDYANVTVSPLDLSRPTRLDPTQANDTAFYTAGSYSTNPLQEYYKIYDDLINEGYSDAVEAAKSKYMTEQNDIVKGMMTELVANPDIDKATKLRMLTEYTSGGYTASDDLKRAFASKYASIKQGKDELDDAQEEANLQTLSLSLAKEEAERFENDVTNTAEKALEAMLTETELDNPKRQDYQSWKDGFEYLTKLGVNSIRNQIENNIAAGENANFFLQTLLDFPNYIARYAKEASTTAEEDRLIKEGKKTWQQLQEEAAKGHEGSMSEGVLGSLALLHRKIMETIGYDPKKMYDTGLGKAFEKIGDWINSGAEVTAQSFKDKGLPDTDQRTQQAYWAKVYEGFAIVLPFGRSYKYRRSLKEADIINDKATDVPFEVREVIAADIDSVTMDINTGLKPKADSPVTVSLNANPKQTGKLLEAAFNDPTGEVFKALRTTPEQVINWFYNLGYVPKQTYKNHVELKPVIENLIELQNRSIHHVFLDPNDPMMPNRHKYLSEIGVLINKEDTFFPSSSLSELRDFYNKIGAKVVYRKDAISDFNSRAHVTEVYKAIQEKIDSLDLTQAEKGKLVIEDVLNPNARPFTSPEQLYKDAKYSRNDLTAVDKQFRIAWYTESKFDPLKASIDGLEAIQFKRGFTKELINVLDSISTKGWNWFAHTGRFPKEFDQAIVMSSLRGSGLGKTQLEFVSAELKAVDFKFSRDLLSVLEAKEHRGRSYSDLNFIRELLPEKTLDYQKKMHRVVATIEHIERFNYRLANELKKTQLQKDGFNRSIVIKQGIDQPNKVVPVKEVFVYERIQHPMVWDVTRQEPVIFKPKNSQQRSIDARDRTNTKAQDGVFDTDGRQLVMLEKAYSPSHGNLYPYVLLGSKEIAKSLPNNVIPFLKGRMPRKLEATYVIRRYFKDVNVSGIKYTARSLQEAKNLFGEKGTVGNFTEAVAAANDLRTANRQANTFNQKDANYFYEVERVREDMYSEVMEAQRIASDVVNQAKTRTKNEIVGAQFEDVATTFVRETNGLNKQFNQSKILNQQKANWVNTFKGKISETAFESIDDIASQFPKIRPDVNSITLSGSKTDIKYARQAVAVWDRINLAEVGVPDNFITGMYRGIGDVIDTVGQSVYIKPLEKIGQSIHKNAAFLEGYPQRVVSTTLIAANIPFKHIALQPMAVLDTMWTAGADAGMANIYNMGGLLKAYALDNIYFRKHREGFNYMLDELYTKGRIVSNNTAIKRSLIMTSEDLQLAAREIKESGFGRVDQHVMAQGIMGGSPLQLNKTFFGKAIEVLGTPFGKLLQVNQRIGFNFGEQLNRFGMWLTAKSLWENKNPGKNWRTAKALNDITYDAWELSGSMTKEGTYAYQRAPILNMVTQFMSYPMKASEMILNGRATPLNPAQRTALQAWRLWFFGVRSGTAYGLGNLLYEYYKDKNTEFAQKLADLLNTDAGMNMILNAMINQSQEGKKANLDFAKTFSPFGGDPGGVYGQLYKFTRRIVTGDVTPNESVAPVVQQIEALNAWWNTVARYNNYHGGIMKPENMVSLFKRSAKVTTGTNALSKAFMRWSMQDKMTRYGQEVGLNDEGKVEGLVSSLLGVMDKDEARLYDSFSNGGYKKPNKMEELAKSLYGDWVSITPEDQRTFLNFDKFKEDMYHVMVDGMYHSEEANQILEYMDDAHNRTESTLKESVLSNIQDKESLDPKSKRLIQDIVNEPEWQEIFETFFPEDNLKFKTDIREENK